MPILEVDIPMVPLSFLILTRWYLKLIFVQNTFSTKVQQRSQSVLSDKESFSIIRCNSRLGTSQNFSFWHKSQDASKKSNDLECYKWSGDDSFLIAR